MWKHTVELSTHLGPSWNYPCTWSLLTEPDTMILMQRLGLCARLMTPARSRSITSTVRESHHKGLFPACSCYIDQASSPSCGNGCASTQSTLQLIDLLIWPHHCDPKHSHSHELGWLDLFQPHNGMSFIKSYSQCTVCLIQHPTCLSVHKSPRDSLVTKAAVRRKEWVPTCIMIRTKEARDN